jgi:hypothetical protein
MPRSESLFKRFASAETRTELRAQHCSAELDKIAVQSLRAASSGR